VTSGLSLLVVRAGSGASQGLFIRVTPGVAPDSTSLYGGLMASVRRFQVTFTWPDLRREVSASDVRDPLVPGLMAR
jgi:hypothetical protein